MNNYIVATTKNWNIENFNKFSKTLPGNWILITEKSKLTYDYVMQINPKYIFFPHWSWIVPKDIVESYRCVCFHMTDLPFGRGGSPLQNLIVRGLKKTKLSALRMSDKLDEGPIYFKRDLDLKGSAHDIFKSASIISFELIKEIIVNEPEPVAQKGDITIFTRRRPEQSLIPKDLSLEQVYDYIRMLDAEGYPRAKIEFGNFILEFEDAKFENEGVEAKVKFYKKES